MWPNQCRWDLSIQKRSGWFSGLYDFHSCTVCCGVSHHGPFTWTHLCRLYFRKQPFSSGITDRGGGAYPLSGKLNVKIRPPLSLFQYYVFFWLSVGCWFFCIVRGVFQWLQVSVWTSTSRFTIISQLFLNVGSGPPSAKFYCLAQTCCCVTAYYLLPKFHGHRWELQQRPI